MPPIPRQAGVLDVDGDELYYETAGDGVPIVFCHGLGGNGGIWYRQVVEFSRDMRVVVWDQRGFGRSTDTGDRSVQAATGDLERILDHLDVHSAHLVGQSMGGWAALGLAVRAPQRVRSLVLSASTGGITPSVAGERRGPVRDAPGTRPLGVHPALGTDFQQRDVAHAYLYQILGSFGHRASDATISARLAARTVGADVLARLTVPTLFLAGEHDELFPPDMVRSCAGLVPGSRMAVLAGVGHSGYFEDPDTWNAHVRGFVREAG